MIESRIDWLKERQKGIGGSDVAAILGLSPWRTPYDVYLDKIGEAPKELTSQAAHFGTKLEAAKGGEFFDVIDRILHKADRACKEWSQYEYEENKRDRAEDAA